MSSRTRRVHGTVWASTVDPADQVTLDPGMPADLDRHPDVLVVGGGVIGLATAVFCRRAGMGRVLVIEAARLAAAASGGAGGALAPALHQLGDPPAFVALAQASLALYHQLDQDWDRALGLERIAGLQLLPIGPPPGGPWPGVELLDSDQVAELVPELVSMPAGLLAQDQARVHPLRLAAALARRAGSVATGLAPEPWVRVPQRLVKGHLVATDPVGFRLRCGVHTPGFGVGSMADGGLLAGGTRDEGDHSARVRPEVVQGIRRRLGELLPAAAQVRVRYQWCCFRPATADGQPVIDRVPGLDNAWVSAGHDGDGLLMAPATGQALASWITTSRQPQEVASFGLSRFDQLR
jgi:glycine oxidase